MNKKLLAIVLLALFIAGCTSNIPTQTNSSSQNLTQPQQAPAENATVQNPLQNLTTSQLIGQLEQSVVEINDTSFYNDSYYGMTPIGSLGSGVVYAEDNDSIYIMTNRHVVDLGYSNDYGIPLQDNISVTTYDNNTVYATDRWIAPNSTDLAIIKIPKSGVSVQVAQLSNATLPLVGDDVFVIGMPEEYTWSVSKGIVSAIRTNFTPASTSVQPQPLYTAIQTDAAVNPGNSGGGMFSQQGQLLGIPTWGTLFTPGLNFAISVNDFMALKNSFVHDPFGSANQTLGGSPAFIDSLQANPSYSPTDYSVQSLNLTFTLLDQNNYATTSDGQLSISIVDDNGTTLYQNSFPISSNDFNQQDYLGRPMYSYNIPVSSMVISASSYANVNVSFTNQGKTINSSTQIYLPDYQNQQSSSYGSYYGSNSNNNYGSTKIINITSSSNDMAVRIDDGSNDGYNDYTIDLTVLNLGQQKQDMEIMDATLVTDGTQYNSDLGGPSDLGNVYPSAGIPATLTFYSISSFGQTATLYIDVRAINDTSVKTSSYTMSFTP